MAPPPGAAQPQLKSPVVPDRVVAVDWSGRADDAGQRRHIWTAEVAGGELVALAGGRTRAALAQHLETLAGQHGRLAVGLDFSFSFPRWWLEERGWPDGPAAWSAAGEEGEAWLERCAPPFWGRPGRRRPGPDTSRPALRATEEEVPATGGSRPSSTFQIGGAGAVGTASVRGMPLLARLRAAGFHVWPFDAQGWPLVVEIYPRVFTGPVRKSDPLARRRALSERRPAIDPALSELTVSSEDAFDAALSALGMAARAHELATLPHLTDRVSRLEGRMWRPGAWA
ncbi:MAG TPA: hypothetical protein VKI20_09755 [Acidimicrobiales bacterium]|nr:hypothetical protein [Acidimicrobiales bacterium]